ncbi:MAG: LptF/LptG family permease [Aureispira sp.]
MKKIDQLLIRSFIPPLLIWTLVAMFIFNMQFLWKYIDDIIGKGVDVSIILELLFYQSLAMIPRAMVFGVLIASVMTLGNLAEHYELATMKSAGLSLFRVMLPLIFFAIFLSGVSFLFSDRLIPITALKFKSTLHDIRNQKPALSFKEGQFNNDFQKVSIYVEKKAANGKVLQGLKIYDHTTTTGYKGQTNAVAGKLFYTKDTAETTIKVSIKDSDSDTTILKDTAVKRSYLVVKLENGTRYEELDPDSDRPTAYPHVEMNFDSYTTLFDMSEFEFNQTDKELFKGHYSLLTTKQLLRAIDSLYKRRKERFELLKRNADGMFHFRREGLALEERDTLPDNSARHLKHYYPPAVKKMPNLVLDSTWEHFYTVIPPTKKEYIYQRAVGFCQNIKGQASGLKTYIKTNRRMHAEHENEVHQKLSYALACLLFLFIGAPMGAIIRKGGFGWPILVALSFFMTFFVLYLVGERLSKGVSITVWIGSWLPNLVLAPFGILLTYMALYDARIVSIDKLQRLWTKVKTFFSKKKEVS